MASVDDDPDPDTLPPGEPGSHAHDERFAALYAELRRIARRESRRHGPQTPLSTTTLLHEAYLNIAPRDALAFPDEAHFLAYAARAMRGLVIDRVRARAALRRGGDTPVTSLDTQTAEQVADPQTLTAISAALDDLATIEPELAQIVDLRFFCGFTMAEIAAQRGISERTVQRQWEKARALLYHALKS